METKRERVVMGLEMINTEQKTFRRHSAGVRFREQVMEKKQPVI